MSHESVFASQILELRRGTIVLAILSQLATPRYGYGLLQQLEFAKIPIDAGTLYPLLRRLEKHGVLESSWETSESRPRKYYQLSADGHKLYEALLQEWTVMSDTITQMTKEEDI
ncbi:MAG: PadR family transcriptional regulator [Candidatus Saccharimonadales bacterium]